jgi:hypothetical protein
MPAPFVCDAMQCGNRRTRKSDRRGLAPVELVVSLPIWMLLASAMVIVGNLGAWKLRGHLAARESAARGLWPRNRAGEENPREWSRPSAGMRLQSAIGPQSTDPLMGHTAIRGPRLTDLSTPLALEVNATAMESLSTALSGEAWLNEPPPLWPRAGVRMMFYRDYPIIDGACGQWTDGHADRFGDRRSSALWNLPEIQ